MSAADMDVESYLAQRKAKKSAARGGQKFKTFTASAAFLATEEDADVDGGDVPVSSSIGGAAPVPTFTASAPSFAAAAGSHAHHIPGPTASVLVGGEWVDDESQFAAQPRLVVGGVSVHDLESLDLNRESATGASSKQQPQAGGVGTARAAVFEGTGESIRPTPAGARRPQGDFPSLSSSVGGSAAPAAAPVASVWGRVDRPAAASLREEPARVQEQPKAAEAESKPNVWRPKSMGTSPAAPPSAGPSMRSMGPAAGGFAAAAQRAPGGSAPSPASDGLKRSADPWKPRRPINE